MASNAEVASLRQEPALPKAIRPVLSRRSLILGFAGLVLAAPAVVARQPNPGALRGRVAELIAADDPRIEMLSRPQNLAYAGTRPLAIARCAEPGHVAASILWARENGVPFVLRSGGHSYAGCSVTSGLLIDMRPMSGILVNADGLVRVGGGALNGDMYAALRARGLTMTHGRCTSVGASAFLMGGGIGFAMRDRGMGCDHVRAASFILANGSDVTASPHDDADLFWGIRGGGGGNLGAATGWTLATVPADAVTFIDLSWADATPDLTLLLARVLERAPARMGTKLTLLPPHAGHGPILKLLGQLRGPREEVADLLAPVLAAAAPGGRMALMPYWDAQDLLSDAGAPAFYRETSCMIGPVSEGLVEDAFHRLRAWPGTNGEGLFKMFHVGGRIREVAADATAYVHREAEWIAGTEVTWTASDSAFRAEAALAWQRAFHWSMDQLTGSSGSSFQNFPDPGLEDPARAYYGSNLARLSAIRGRVDPSGAFQPPRRQGIPSTIQSAIR
jgi:FAD/FMN-containing dehydrogenase